MDSTVVISEMINDNGKAMEHEVTSKNSKMPDTLERSFGSFISNQTKESGWISWNSSSNVSPPKGSTSASAKINQHETNAAQFTQNEQDTVLNSFKNKAAMAYLITIGCNNLKSLEDMTKCVMKNDMRNMPRDKSKRRKKKSEKYEPKTKQTQLELQQAIKQTNSSLDNRSSSEICKNTSLANSFEKTSAELVKKNNRKSKKSCAPERDCLNIKYNPLTPERTRKFCYLKPGIPKGVQNKELETKVLLPPLGDKARKKYTKKVNKQFRVENIPNNLQTKKQHEEHIKECREQDFKWRDFLNNFALEVHCGRFISERHFTLKDLEKSHLGPGLYEVSEYDDIQKKKRLQLQRGFDSSLPRFQDKDEFQHIGPYSYGDGPFKYDNLMKGGGSKKSNLSTACRFKYGINCGDLTATHYDTDGCIDTLLKSKKGVIYPKDRMPLHKMLPRNDYYCYETPNQEIQRPNDRDHDKILNQTLYNLAHDVSDKYPRGGILEKLYNRDNYFKGKFKTLSPMASILKSSVDETNTIRGPGPGSYNVATESSALQTKVKKQGKGKCWDKCGGYVAEKTFLVVPEAANSVNIGPGSYNLDRKQPNALTSMFKSETPQRLRFGDSKWESLDERLKGKDIPLSERLASIVN